MTITNSYALFVDSGSARFDGFIINTNDEITYGDGGSGNITYIRKWFNTRS